MSSTTIYIRTGLGNAELQNPKGKIAGDEKRLMLLIDGKSSVEEIGKKVPPSVRGYLEDVFSRLSHSRFIEEVSNAVVPEKSQTILQNIKIPGRVSKEEVQAILMTSQKFNKNILLLAEVEIERRMELEQDLAAAEVRMAEMRSRLEQAEAHSAATSSRYETFKQQVLGYRQGMQAKVEAMQAYIQKCSGSSQEYQFQRAKAEADLGKMRKELERMHADAEDKEAHLDETMRVRLLEAQSREKEQCRRSKIEADEMVRSHPRYTEVRCLDFFKDFRNSDLAQFLVWVEWRDYKAGETVVVEGERDMMLYLVVTGKLAVLKGARILHVLQAGEPFGEISFLDDENPLRSATVKARTDCTLLCFNPAQLDSAEVMIRMRVAEALVRIQAKRLRRSLEVIENLLADGAN